MRTQKNIPLLRFPEFTGEWEKKKLGEVADKITDGTHDTPKPVKVGVPFLTAIHIKDGFIDYENCYFLDKDVHNSIYKRCNPEKNDLLIVNIGAGTATCALNIVDYEFSLKNVALIKPNKKIIDGEFLAQIQRKKAKKIFSQLTSGGAQPFLSLNEIGKLIITFPALPEQKRIASFFTVLDKKISELKQKKNLLEQYKKGVMQKIFSQELRFKDDKGKDFPKWEKKKLGEVAEINPRSEKLPQSFIYIDLESVVQGRLTKEGRISLEGAPSRAQRLLKKNDILFQMVRPYQKNNYFFVSDKTDYVASTGYAQIRTKNNSLFLYQFLHEETFVNKVIEKCTGTSYPSINSSDLAIINIDIPSIKEQDKIANFLNALDEKLNRTENQIQQTEQYKKGLLQNMFV